MLLRCLASAVIFLSLAACVHATDTTLNGIDVLERDGFQFLKGRHIGLITNQTGIDREGHSTIDVLKNAPGIQLVALFSPEHGIRGTQNEKVASSVDEKTGLPIHSLYGDTRQPTRAMLEGVDTLVFDIQDIGTRFYTYISTLGLAMQAASQHGLRFVVLDRVNPIDGVDVEGPLADADALSFICFHRLPVRHGMTVGELAQMFKEELNLKCDLQVVKLQGWSREAWFDATGLPWKDPSPNIRNLTEMTLYPGIGLLETSNVSVGRGTDTPFEVVGAPWIDERTLAAALNEGGLAGVRFVPLRFTPRSSVFAGVECGGVNVLITERPRFAPVACGLEIAATLRHLYPDRYECDKVYRLLANRRVCDALMRGEAARRLWAEDEAQFRARRARYLLY